MHVVKLVDKIIELFHGTDKEIFLKESGITYQANRDVKKIGYCVNLTLETVEDAKNQGVDMIITHHDAWGEIYGLKEACTDKLSEYQISHYYNHLPLDDCDFGTNDSLVKKLGLKSILRTHEWEGLYFGRVAESNEEIEFIELVNRMETLLEEPMKFLKFNNNKIKRVCLVAGNGGTTSCVREAVENNCDVFITGECDLPTIQYSKFKKINLIIGSHTFTEIFGVQSLAMKLKEKIETLEIVQLSEEHY